MPLIAGWIRSCGAAGLAGLLAVCVVLSAHATPLVIGGFDANRGGFESLQAATPGSPALLSPYTGLAENSGLADMIGAAMPGTTFAFSNTLTSGFLSGVDAVILGVGAGLFNAITPLTNAEQSALWNFVLGGGIALIFADNSTFDANAPVANASLLDPFGVTMTGIFAPGTAPILDPNGSLTGPFTPVTTFAYGYTGFFTDTNGGEVLANMNDPSMPMIDHFAPGFFGAGSGRVVLFSDSDAMVVAETTMNVNMILNALSVPEAVPEPGAAAILGGGLIAFGMLGWVLTARRKLPVSGVTNWSAR